MFHPETANLGGQYLDDADTELSHGHQHQHIELVTLDSLDLRRPVSFVKMDVEGAEPQVVAGARQLLSEDRPLILCELHAGQMDKVAGVSPSEFVVDVTSLGYRCHRIAPGGELGAEFDINEDVHVLNVAFVPA